MQQRHLKDFGLQPVWALPLIAILFTLFSYYIFKKLSYAGYIYVLLALSFIIQNSNTSRNQFLRYVFSRSQYFRIRLAENYLMVLPFLLVLCIMQALLPALILVSLTACLSCVAVDTPGHIIIPTPFYKKPFEFVTGFRQQLFLLVPAFVLSVIAVIYHNANIGLFALAIIFLTAMSFYNEPEEDIYVWIHSLWVNAFLLEKIRTAIIYSTILALPVTVSLFIFFPGKAWITPLVQLVGYCYLCTMILAKYASYPGKMNLPQSLLLSAGIVFPPLMLVLAPYFYTRSKKQLKALLA